MSSLLPHFDQKCSYDGVILNICCFQFLDMMSVLSEYTPSNVKKNNYEIKGQQDTFHTCISGQS